MDQRKPYQYKSLFSLKLPDNNLWIHFSIEFVTYAGHKSFRATRAIDSG